MKTFAETLRPHVQSAPVNIEQIIRDFGINLDSKADLDPDVAGQIERLPDGSYKISANLKDHYFRRRFTLAHELGHWILHRDLIGSGVDDSPAYRSTNAGKFFNTSIKRNHETEANQIAASLLMPAKLVRREFEACSDVTILSKKFQVSAEAMKIRLKGLDLLS